MYIPWKSTDHCPAQCEGCSECPPLNGSHCPCYYDGEECCFCAIAGFGRVVMAPGEVGPRYNSTHSALADLSESHRPAEINQAEKASSRAGLWHKIVREVFHGRRA